jgi:hypothetical protein
MGRRVSGRSDFGRTRPFASDYQVAGLKKITGCFDRQLSTRSERLTARFCEAVQSPNFFYPWFREPERIDQRKYFVR